MPLPIVSFDMKVLPAIVLSIPARLGLLPFIIYTFQGLGDDANACF